MTTCEQLDAVLIRDARHDEAESLGRLVQACYAEFETRYPPEAWQRYHTMLGQVSEHLQRAEVIVAERPPELLGTVTFYPDGSLSGQGPWPPGWAGVLRLAVVPAHRNRGLGRALIDECIRRCQARDIAILGLHTTEWMEVARGMYERMGFVRDESFDFIPRPGVYGFGYKLELSQDR